MRENPTTIVGPAPAVAVVVSQLGRGGAERQTVELLTALRESTWRPTVVVCLSTDLLPFGDHVQSLGYRLEVLPRGSSFDPRRIWSLRKLLLRSNVRVVHAVHLLASAYAFLSTRGKGSPAVLPTVRGTVIDPGPLRSLVYRWMFRRCPRALVNSSRGAEFIRTRFGVPAEKLRVVPNGIDFQEIEASAAKSQIRTALGIARDTPLIAYVGKNSKVKNVPRFIATWATIAAHLPDAHAVLVGGGLGDSFGASHVDETLLRRTHFLGPRDDVPAVLAQADVLVLTSNSEGTPNVILEALALGTPVVSTDVGDVGRMILSGETGFIVASGAADELAAAALCVLGARERFRDAVRADRRRLERDYAVGAMVDATVELWREIARSHDRA